MTLSGCFTRGNSHEERHFPNHGAELPAAELMGSGRRARGVGSGGPGTWHYDSLCPLGRSPELTEPQFLVSCK